MSFEAGTLVVQKGKSARARRMIPLAGQPLADLRRWVEENRLEPPDPLFPCVTNGGLRHAWERTREAVGLDDVRFHDLRHTYAVHCAKAGMPLGELQQRARACHDRHDHEVCRLLTPGHVRPPPAGSSGTRARLADGLGLDSEGAPENGSPLASR